MAVRETAKKTVAAMLLEKQFGKPIYKSMTGIGLMIMVAGSTGVTEFCGESVATFGGDVGFPDAMLPQAVCVQLDSMISILGEVLAFLGIRRKM